jgi:hypothetical protein
VKLDLPDDHPIAKTIRDLTNQGLLGNGRLMLSLDHFGRMGHQRIFSLDDDGWTATEKKSQRFELDLTDAFQRDAEIQRLTQWPEMPKLSDDHA